MSTQQKSLLLVAPQGDYVVASTAIPKPGPGELLVEIESAALNPVDWVIRDRIWSNFDVKFPAVLGTDAAGVVKEIGDGVTTFSIGDRVVSQGLYADNKYTAFQQYTIMPADVTGKIPANISFDQAATLPVALCAAVLGFYGPKGNRPGAALTAPWEKGGRGKYANTPVLIIGGSSSVGQFAIQLARLSGFAPIITTASLRNTQLLKDLGATHVLDRSLSSSALQATVQDIVKGPVQLVFDSISVLATQTAGYELLAPGGTIILVRKIEVPPELITADKEIADILGVVHIPEKRAAGVSFFKNLPGLLESGDIKPTPLEVLSGGLAAIPAGLERLKNGTVSAKKLVVHPKETS